MRKIFTFLTMCLLATAVWGQTEITFIPGETVGNNETAQGADQMSKDGITVSTDNGGLKAAQYRFAKGSTTTFTSAIGTIIKIEFTCTASGETKYGPGCFAPQTGYSFEGNVGTWVGAATSVQFKAESNQVRASKIVVTVDAGGLLAPSISPAGGTYYAPITVTMSCATSGAEIYYTLNGQDPTTASTKYTAPFTVSENTTVKAISALDGETSKVTTAAYNFAEASAFGWGDMFNAQDNDAVVFTYPSTVLVQSGINIYCKDETGYGLVYGDVAQTYNRGDIIPAGFRGTKATYNSKPELKSPAGFMPASGHVDVNPEVITPAQVGDALWAHLVRLNGVKIVTQDRVNGTLEANGESCPMFNNTFKIDLPDDLEQEYDVIGIVAAYQRGGQGEVVYQILPVEVLGGVEPQPIPVASINELYALNQGRKGIFTTPLTTIYQNGPNLYVIDQEGTYSLAYGSVAYKEFTNGDYINDAVASWTLYSGNKQLAPVEETFVKAGHGNAIEPVVLPIEEISKDMVHWYLGFEDVTITESDGSYIMEDETGSMILYDRFGVLKDMDLTNTHYIEGFLTVYKDALELYPIMPIEVQPVYLPEDVDKNGEVNITDVNLVIDAILSGNFFENGDVDGNGEINLSDVNRVLNKIFE